MAIDIDELYKLMTIAEKAVNWPKLKSIHDQALQKLEEHAVELQQQMDKAKEDKARAARTAEAEQAARDKQEGKETTTPTRPTFRTETEKNENEQTNP